MASVSDSNISRNDGTKSHAEYNRSGDLDPQKVVASVSDSGMGTTGSTKSDGEKNCIGDPSPKKVEASVSGSNTSMGKTDTTESDAEGKPARNAAVDFICSRLKTLSNIQENKQSPGEKEEMIQLLSVLKTWSKDPLFSDIALLRQFEQIIPSPSIPKSVRLDVSESTNSIAVSTITNSNDYSLHDSRTNNNPTPFVENSTAANVTIVTSSTKGMDENRLQDISSSRSSLSLYSVGKPNGLF